MPISPSDIGRQFSQAAVDAVVNVVDSTLSHPQLVETVRYDEYFTIHCKGSLTSREKLEVTRLYREAGWAKVTVTNSDDNGEKSGLVVVRLYPEEPTSDV